MGLSVSQKACVCLDYHIYYNYHNYNDDNDVDYNNNNYYYYNNNHNNFDYYNFCNKFGGNVLGEG